MTRSRNHWMAHYDWIREAETVELSAGDLSLVLLVHHEGPRWQCAFCAVRPPDIYCGEIPDGAYPTRESAIEAAIRKACSKLGIGNPFAGQFF